MNVKLTALSLTFLLSLTPLAAHADRDATPAKTVTHQVITAPTTDLKAVRVDTNDIVSNDHYLLGVDPSTIMTNRPETIPHGTKTGASSSQVTLLCLAFEGNNNAPSHKPLTTSASFSPDPQEIYNGRCNTTYTSFCEGDCTAKVM